MPAPASLTYSDEVLEDASDALLAIIEAGTGPGQVKIYNDNDEELAVFAFTEPAGTVATGGTLTLTTANASENADQSGTATWAAIFPGSTATACVTIPVVESPTPVSGYLALNTVALVDGSPVTFVSAVIG